MSDPVTPVVEGTPTTPATPAVTTPASETVTVSAKELEQLKRDAARASSAQSRADRLERVVGRTGSHFGGLPPVTPPTPPTPEETEARASAEDRKAERGLLSLAVDPKYRAALDADPTLRDMLTRNPLSILPVYAADALDAEDAIQLVREALDKRLESATPATTTPSAAAPATAPTTAAPAAAAPNVSDTALDTEYEAAKKNPNTEQALASMIGVGLKKFGKTGKS